MDNRVYGILNSKIKSSSSGITSHSYNNETNTLSLAFSDGMTQNIEFAQPVDGKSLEFNWNGTNLGIRQEGTSEYTYVDLHGRDGLDGRTICFGHTYTTISDMNTTIATDLQTDELCTCIEDNKIYKRASTGLPELVGSLVSGTTKELIFNGAAATVGTYNLSKNIDNFDRLLIVASTSTNDNRNSLSQIRCVEEIKGKTNNDVFFNATNTGNISRFIGINFPSNGNTFCVNAIASGSSYVMKITHIYGYK